LPKLPWNEEEKKHRAKQQLLQVVTGIHNFVAARRFLTQGDWLGCVPELPPAAAGEGAGDAVDATWGGGEESGPTDDGFSGYDEDVYFQQFEAMLETTNVDGEVAILNHLTFDLLDAWTLERTAQHHSLTEVQHLLKKIWIPWLQQGGQRGHFHVIKHMVRQLLAHYTRSERRAFMAFINTAPNVGNGTFGMNSVELDAIQELLC